MQLNNTESNANANANDLSQPEIMNEIQIENQIENQSEMNALDEADFEDKDSKKIKMKPKKDKEKDKDQEKQTTKKQYFLGFNLTNDPDVYMAFENVYKNVNNKSVGRAISKEDILKKLVNLIDDNFVLKLQKESLSEDELNQILRTHLTANNQ
ncbi:MAG: hypothetical protein HQK49_13605 [Oligoflexia bacterium]|nr:hypothetical protein [Oligoflexia bacterium]